MVVVVGGGGGGGLPDSVDNSMINDLPKMVLSLIIEARQFPLWPLSYSFFFCNRYYNNVAIERRIERTIFF